MRAYMLINADPQVMPQVLEIEQDSVIRAILIEESGQPDWLARSAMADRAEELGLSSAAAFYRAMAAFDEGRWAEQRP